MMTCPSCWGGGCSRCKGAGTVLDIRLSENFWLSEILRSDTAFAEKIPNDPSIRALGRIHETVNESAQPLRNHFGPVYVTSGFRTPEVNRRVGGADPSAHTYGWALDVALAARPEEVARWFLASDLVWDQIILYDNRVHLGWKKPPCGSQRREIRIQQGKEYPLWKS